MTHSSGSLEFSFPLDITQEERRLWRERREERIGQNQDQDPNQHQERKFEEFDVPRREVHQRREEKGKVCERTLRESSTSRTLCKDPFSLSICLLPIFKRSSKEDPHKHLKHFNIVCDWMRLITCRNTRYYDLLDRIMRSKCIRSISKCVTYVVNL